jgi:sugar phosphate isomerase/epimerase
MIRIGMSTSSVAPLPTETAFRLAHRGGFDGIEVMVTQDPVTQDATQLLALSHRFEQPILSIHAPVLPLAQLVWGLDPAHKLEKSAELATAVGASTVVVHPPFRWERRYGRVFEQTIRRLERDYPVQLAVENMFPWRVGPLNLRGYSPSPDPTRVSCDAITLDFSHAALAGRDSLEYAMAMGPRLRHVHLCDGPGSMAEGFLFDEHRIPGHGTQPVAEVLTFLASQRWSGSLIAEVNTRGAKTEAGRLAMLVETRKFAKAAITTGKSLRHKRARADPA